MFGTINTKLENRFRKIVKKVIAEPTSIDLVILQSKLSASLWIQANLEGAILFSDRPKIQEYAARLAARRTGDFLEMGVFRGTSISRFSRVFTKLGASKKLTGIDTFRGLDDAWSNVDHLDAFDLGGVAPKLSDPAINLEVGSVQDVLPTWLRHNPDQLALIHFDMDLYAPTKFAIETLAHQIGDGTLILFDNFHSYPGWELGEFRALKETLLKSNYSFKAFGPYQCLIEISC